MLPYISRGYVFFIIFNKTSFLFISILLIHTLYLGEISGQFENYFHLFQKKYMIYYNTTLTLTFMVEINKITHSI